MYLKRQLQEKSIFERDKYIFKAQKAPLNMYFDDKCLGKSDLKKEKYIFK